MKNYLKKLCKRVTILFIFSVLSISVHANPTSSTEGNIADVEEQGRIMSEVISCYENDQYEDAQRLNAMLPEYADDPTESELTDDMKKAYKEKIESYYGYKSSDKNYLVSFYLSDVNNDKVCDLILQLGESRQGDRCEAYTFLDNKVSLVSSSVAPDSLCDYPNHKGVLSVGFNNGTYERYLYILLYENKFDSFKTLKKCMSYLDLRCKLKRYLIKREENKVYFDCKLLTSSTSVISPASPEAISSIGRTSINVTAILKKKVKVKASAISGANRYQYQLSTDSGFRTISKNKKSKNTTHSFSGLVADTTYYVRARAYYKPEKGKKVFGDWSDVISIQTKTNIPKNISLPDEVYNAVKNRWYEQFSHEGCDAKFNRTKLTEYERGSHKVLREYNLISVEKLKNGFWSHYKNQYKLTYRINNGYDGYFFYISREDRPLGVGFDYFEDYFGDGKISYSGGAALFAK